MTTYVRAPVAIAAAALALLLASSAARSQMLVTVEPAGSMTATSLGSLTFRSPLATVTCSLTINGSFEPRAFVHSAAGTATRASVEGCRGATVTTDASAEAPWTIAAGEILGTLPSLTGMQIGFYSAGFLFDVPFLGLHVRCLYKGHLGGLTRLSGTGPYRTALIALQTASEEFVLYDELDTTGLCPSEEEVTVTGELSMTTETLSVATVPFSIDSPAIPIVYAGTEAKVITFRNTSGVMQRLRRVRLHNGAAGFAIEANTCLEAGETPKQFAANATCTVTVRFTQPAGRQSRFDILDLFGDPGESILGGVGVSWLP